MNFYYSHWNCLMRHLITVWGESSLRSVLVPAASDEITYSQVSFIDNIPAVLRRHNFPLL